MAHSGNLASTALHYRESGSGEPVVFLGFAGQPFDTVHRVIEVEAEQHLTPTVLRHLLDEIGVTAASIVAHGAAAEAALALAAAHPQHVRRLALVEPRVTPDAARTILCPALVLSGDDDAAAALGLMPRLQVERPSDVTAQIVTFLQRRLSSFDNRELAPLSAAS